MGWRQFLSSTGLGAAATILGVAQLTAATTHLSFLKELKTEAKLELTDDGRFVSTRATKSQPQTSPLTVKPSASTKATEAHCS